MAGILTGLATAAPAAAATPLTYSLTGGGKVIPRSYLGTSFEYDTLHVYEGMGSLFDRTLGLFRPQNGARMILRVGGKSADHIWWEPNGGQAPPVNVQTIGNPFVSELGTTASADHLQIMLDLNLAVHSATMETAFAKAAEKKLGSNLAAVQIGNEPDLYSGQANLQQQKVSSTREPHNWTENYDPADYRDDYKTYAKYLKKALPHLALAGPETAGDGKEWLDSVTGLGSLDPGYITIHRYAGSYCFSKTNPDYPSIPLLLSNKSTMGLAGTIVGAAELAHSIGAQLRIDEVNTVSCAGNGSVAQTFASALWSTDVLFSFLTDGANGVNWHIRTDTPNAPFYPVIKTVDRKTVQTIEPMPELYGLALFADVTGPGAELLYGRTNDPSNSTLRVWPVKESGGIRCVLINKAKSAQSVTLDLGGYSKGSLRRLLAPNIHSTYGVTFGGQKIGPDATWVGKRKVTNVTHRKAGPWRVTLPGYSAALLTLSN